jgi:hypothetical protein
MPKTNYFMVTKRNTQDNATLYYTQKILSSGQVLDMFTGNINKASTFDDPMKASEVMQYLSDRDITNGIYNYDYDLIDQNQKEVYFNF